VEALTKNWIHPRFGVNGCSGAQILIECFERFDLDAVLETRDRAKATFGRSGNWPFTIACCWQGKKGTVR
jgi:hypothetical protein